MYTVIEKHGRIHLPEWLKAAEGERCTWPGCGKRDGTVVAAHSDMLIHGKGMKRKADDLFIAFLCNDCHYAYGPGRELSREEKRTYFFMAMSATWRRLYERGFIICN